MRTMLGVLMGLFGATVTVVAHHGYDVEYDTTKPVEAVGVISRVEWTNPHMRVYVDVTDAKGVVTTWNLEMGRPNNRQGAAAVWAMLEVDIEDAFEQSGPAQATQVGGRGCLGLSRSGRVRLGGGAPNNRRTQFSVGASTPWNGMDAFHL